MIRLFANANYDFIKWRRWAYMLTALMILPGLVLLAVRGINYSIEFTGGTMLQVRTHRVEETGVLLAFQVRENNRELITAETADRILAAQALP